MQRRNFIKSLICLTYCPLFAGCSNTKTTSSSNSNANIDFPTITDIPKDFNPKESRFYYKSKEDLPREIRLEACSLCQLNCVECVVRKLEKIAPKDWLGYLKFKDFRELVDDNYFEQIELSDNGEIFLNPELDDIIEYAYRKKIKLNATNGVNLNTVSDKTLENLVKYNFNQMSISIDGATAQTYKIYRRNGDFNVVIDNIKKINYYKKKYNSEFPKLTWQFILFGHSEHEIEAAKKMAEDLGMDISYKINMAQNNYSPIKNKKLVEKQTGIKIASRKESLELKFNKQKKSRFACYSLFNSPQINFNGDLLGCCPTSISNFEVNVFKVGLLEALNSKNVIYAKHMLTDLTYPLKKDFPCAKCERYYILKRNKIVLSIP